MMNVLRVLLAALSGTALIIAIAVLLPHTGLNAQDDSPEGRIVEIAPSDEEVDLSGEPRTTVVEEPGYWIGFRGRGVENAVLRTHLQLAEDMGVVVEEVVPDSPAAKAGLRQHDIILRANGEAVTDMSVLQEMIADGEGKPIDLTLIRLGKEQKLTVTPEERPEQFNQRSPAGEPNNFPGLEGRGDVFQELFGQLQDQRGGMRMFGPGIVMRGFGADMANLPNGVSVSIQRQNDQPAKITVRRGEETWELEADDPQALDQLPEELRPFVRGMLQGNAGLRMGDLNAQMQEMLPRIPQMDRDLQHLQPGIAGQNERDLQKKMQEIEKQLQQLQEQLRKEQ